MVFHWTGSEVKVPVLGRETTDIEFTRALAGPVLLDAEFSKDFTADRWLQDATDPSTGCRPLDRTKFLDFFGRERLVSVEVVDCDGAPIERRTECLGDFIDNLDNGSMSYLKDWHAQKETPMPSDVYEDHLPVFMRMDWVNGEAWTPSDDHPLQGDYRFFYIGGPGSRTLLHSDVFTSFSWSMNVTGIKQWLFLPTQETTRFFDSFPDATDLTKCGEDPIREFGVLELIQSPGQIVIVPPGWCHQVLNLTECWSINHNVIGPFNAFSVARDLDDRLRAVLVELDDQKSLRDENDFAEVVEAVLNADFRLTHRRLFALADAVIASRPKVTFSTVDGIENPEFWPTASPEALILLLDCDCKDSCQNKDRHLLSTSISPCFRRKMHLIDAVFVRTLAERLKKSIQP